MYSLFSLDMVVTPKVNDHKIQTSSRSLSVSSITVQPAM